MKLSAEENLLIDILFDRKIRKERFFEIDYEKLVKISSSHLVLPSLYKNLSEKLFLKYIPKDLQIYLKKIYSINRNRNSILLKEIDFISKLFDENKIKYLYIKGAYLINEKILNIDERMVGDIDILVERKDLNKVEKILHKQNYTNKKKYKLWKTRHLPRFTNTSKTFAVEIHSEILKIAKLKELDSDSYFAETKKLNNIALIKSLVLSYEINDNGFLKKSYSLKNIYDVIKLIKHRNIVLKNQEMSKYTTSYFLKTNKLRITDFKIEKKLRDRIYEIIFELKYRSNFIKIFIYLYSEFIINIKIKSMQIVEMTINSNYRIRVFKKLFGKKMNII